MLLSVRSKKLTKWRARLSFGSAALLIVAALVLQLHDDSPRSFRLFESTYGGLATASGPSATSSTADPTDVASISTSITLNADTAALPDGGTISTYTFPNGSVLTVPTPPAGFDPLTASDAELALYDFPARPTDATDLADWTRAMAAYTSDLPPANSMTFDGVASNFHDQSSYNWSGFDQGTQGLQNTNYIGVKGEITVPSFSGTSCQDSYPGQNGLGAWVGLGGTPSNGVGSPLVQEGIECGSPLQYSLTSSELTSAVSAFRPFFEFVPDFTPTNSEIQFNPIAFCGQLTWTIPAGDIVYMNMGYETGPQIANFFLEDLTTGTTHSCSENAVSLWSFDGNTADWIVESPEFNLSGQLEPSTPADFGAVPFTDVNSESGSTGTWSQLVAANSTKYYQSATTQNLSLQCMFPSTIAGNGDFSVNWSTANC